MRFKLVTKDVRIVVVGENGGVGRTCRGGSQSPSQPRLSWRSLASWRLLGLILDECGKGEQDSCQLASGKVHHSGTDFDFLVGC